MTKYILKSDSEDYIYHRIAKSKQEIKTTIFLSFFVPLLFLTLKTNFFSKEIKGLMIIVCVGMVIFSLLTMVRMTIKRLYTFQKLVKEISFDEDGNALITLISGSYFKEKTSSFSLFEGYKGPQKMKNIFNEEFTYRIENYEKDLEFYFISSYFENWEEIKKNWKIIDQRISNN